MVGAAVQINDDDGAVGVGTTPQPGHTAHLTEANKKIHMHKDDRKGTTITAQNMSTFFSLVGSRVGHFWWITFLLLPFPLTTQAWATA